MLEIPERPRPAVGHDQRDGVFLAALVMDEMNRYVVDYHAIVGESVHLRFVLAPVVVVQPVVEQRLQIGLLGAVAPRLVAEVIGQLRIAQATLEVFELAFGDVDLKLFRAHAVFPVHDVLAFYPVAVASLRAGATKMADISVHSSSPDFIDAVGGTTIVTRPNRTVPIVGHRQRQRSTA